MSVSVIEGPTWSVAVTDPSRPTQVVEITGPGTQQVVEVEVPGNRGLPGPTGPPGPIGGEAELPDLSIIFENGLI